jgi:hypothetical protein
MSVTTEDILQVAEGLGIDVSSWRPGGEYHGTDEHISGLLALCRQKHYEQQWPYLHNVADAAELHVEDCPMTNSNSEARLECVCRAYDPAERTVAEGG